MSFAKIIAATCFLLVLAGLGVTDAMLLKEETFEQTTEVTEVPLDQYLDMEGALKQFGLTAVDTTEESLLREVIPSDIDVHMTNLMLDGDRLAFAAWNESEDTKVYFIALKTVLHRSFSDQVTDLKDEVQMRDKQPTRGILTFLDPAIHEERLIFIRLEDRLYEFHVAAGKEAQVQELVDALTSLEVEK